MASMDQEPAFANNNSHCIAEQVNDDICWNIPEEKVVPGIDTSTKKNGIIRADEDENSQYHFK
jgi:hypothetical protein